MNLKIKTIGDFNTPLAGGDLTRKIGEQTVLANNPKLLPSFGQYSQAEFWLYDLRTNGKPFGRLSTIQRDDEDLFAVVSNANSAPEHAVLIETSAYLKWDRKFEVYGHVAMGCALPENSSRSGCHGDQAIFLFGWNLETGYNRKGEGTCLSEGATLSFAGGVRNQSLGFSESRLSFPVDYPYGMDFVVQGHRIVYRNSGSQWVSIPYNKYGGYTHRWPGHLTVTDPTGVERKSEGEGGWVTMLGQLDPTLWKLVKISNGGKLEKEEIVGAVKILDGVPNAPTPPKRAATKISSHMSPAAEISYRPSDLPPTPVISSGFGLDTDALGELDKLQL